VLGGGGGGGYISLLDLTKTSFDLLGNLAWPASTRTKGRRGQGRAGILAEKPASTRGQAAIIKLSGKKRDGDSSSSWVKSTRVRERGGVNGLAGRAVRRWSEKKEKRGEPKGGHRPNQSSGVGSSGKRDETALRRGRWVHIGKSQKA